LRGDSDIYGVEVEENKSAEVEENKNVEVNGGVMRISTGWRWKRTTVRR